MLATRSTTELFPNIFRDFFNTDVLAAPVAGISVNLSENDKDHVIEAAVPGVPKDEIQINIDDNLLTIAHEHKSDNEEKTDKYVRREFKRSAFKRSFVLPKNSDTEKISARSEDGVLKITIPKLAKDKYIKSIEVK